MPMSLLNSFIRDEHNGEVIHIDTVLQMRKPGLGTDRNRTSVLQCWLGAFLCVSGMVVLSPGPPAFWRWHSGNVSFP